jgi:hypothetical protein
MCTLYDAPLPGETVCEADVDKIEKSGVPELPVEPLREFIVWPNCICSASSTAFRVQFRPARTHCLAHLQRESALTKSLSALIQTAKRRHRLGISLPDRLGFNRHVV